MKKENTFLAILGYMRYCLKQYPWLFPVSLVVIVAAYLLEGIGISLFVPLMHILKVGGEAEVDNRFIELLLAGFRFLGIPIELKYLLGTLFSLFILKNISLFSSRMLGVYMTAEYKRRKQAQIFGSIVGARIRFAMEKRLGVLSNTIVNEIHRAGAGIATFLDLAAEFVAMGTYLTVSCLMDWRITVFSIGLAALSFLALKPIISKARFLGKSRQEQDQDLQSLVYETFSSLKVIKGMGREKYFNRRAKDIVEKLKQISVRMGLNKAVLSVVHEPVIIGLICLGIWGGSKWFALNLEIFLVLAVLLYRSYRKMSILPIHLHALNNLIPSYNLVERTLAEAEDLQEQERPGLDLEKFQTLEVKNLSYSYDEEPVLQDIDFEVKRGEMLALVGPTGSGKSTLLSILMNLLPEYKGKILINNKPMSEIGLKSWRQRIGFVSQDILLFNASVQENISFFRDLPQKEVAEAAEKASCLEFIDRLPQKFQTVIGDRGVKLSGGQQQRLALARALVFQPELLFLDEATSNLDSESERKIQQAIQELHQEVTIVVIAHRLSTIRQADRIIVLHQGRIKETGSFKELISKKGKFFKLWQQQSLASIEILDDTENR